MVHNADQHASAAVHLAVDAHRAKQFELVFVVLAAVDVGDPSSAEAGPSAAVEFRDFVSHGRKALGRTEVASREPASALTGHVDRAEIVPAIGLADHGCSTSADLVSH